MKPFQIVIHDNDIDESYYLSGKYDLSGHAPYYELNEHACYFKRHGDLNIRPQGDPRQHVFSTPGLTAVCHWKHSQIIEKIKEYHEENYG